MVKVLALTFSRVGSLVPPSGRVDLKKDLWTIPGERMKMGKDHSIPLTDPIKEVFETLRSFNGDKDYVFFSPRRRAKLHISRDSPNHHLASLGYKE